MRVVLVADRFPKPSETFVVQRFVGLCARGLDVHVVCDSSIEQEWSFFPHIASSADLRARVHTRWRSSPRAVAALLTPLAFLTCIVRAPRTTIRFLIRGWNVLGPVRTIIRLYREAEIIKLSPDVVHAVFGTAAIGSEAIGELLACAYVVSFQGADINYVGLEHDPGYYAPLWRQADGFHFQGNDLLRRAQRRGYVADGRERVILPGVDASDFAASARVRADGEPLRLLSVGRLHWKKGYEYALEAVRRLMDRGVSCVYRIIGDGDFAESVRFACHDMRLDHVVEFLGPQPAARVQEEMQWADVLLHAATSEGFCYAVVEAQAMELPIVTSDADGLPENVLDHQTGFVVPRRDPEALATALAKLASDPGLRKQMGDAGRARVLDVFTPEAELEGFESLYRASVIHASRRTERQRAH